MRTINLVPTKPKTGSSGVPLSQNDIAENDQEIAGEFWMDSRRAPKRLYDLSGLGIDEDRGVILSRRTSDY